jgi:dihydrofolate reductase
MKPKIQLFIAETLDGFIARENGSIDWLLELPNPGNTDHGYNAFIAGTGSLIMGRKTYEDVLGFGIPWPYTDQKTYVVSKNHGYSISTPATFLLTEINRDTVSRILSESSKNIWLVGGGGLISLFLELDLIDEMVISVIPVLLGKGIPLFPEHRKETKLLLSGTETFETGVVNLCYTVIRQ